MTLISAMTDRQTRMMAAVFSLSLMAACTHASPQRSVVEPRGSEVERCERIQPAHYDVTVRVTPSTSKIEATARLRLSCFDGGALTFYLNRALTIREVALDGSACTVARGPEEPLPYVDSAVSWSVDCPQSTVAEPVLEVAYSGALAETYAAVNQVTEELVELAIYAAWYPIFVDARPFTSELRVELPEAMQAISRGRVAESRTEGDQRIEHWVAHTPARDLVLLASPYFEQVEAVPDGATVVIHYAHLPTEHVAHIAGLAQRSLELFTEHFGSPAMEGAVQVVYSPRAGWGYSRTGLIVLSEQRAIARLTDETQIRDEVHGAAHEIAHFWWQLADTSANDDWLNEALAEYSAMRASEHLYGAEEAQRWRRRYREHLEAADNLPALLDTTAESPHRYVNWYERGALLFHALEQCLGRESLDAFLAGLHDRCGGAPLTTARFEAWIGEKLDDEQRALLDTWLRRPALPGGCDVGGAAEDLAPE